MAHVTYKRLPSYISADREEASLPWYVLLVKMFEKGDIGNVNEAKRTRARQEELVRQKGVWSPSNPFGAARYSPQAPHIREGRVDHAIDVNTSGAFITRAAKLGIRLYRAVSTEEWHLEVHPGDVGKFIAFYRKHRAQVLGMGHRKLRPGMRGLDVLHFQKLAKRKGILAKDHTPGKLYGPRVALKVRAWKKKHKMPVDSVIGGDMWKILED